MTITGTVSGTFTQGGHGQGFTCGPNGGGSYNAGPIVGIFAGGTSWSLQIAWIDNSYSGPGSYTSGYALTFLIGDKGYVGTARTTLTIAADEHSGTITGDLFHDGDTGSLPHISGSWRCPTSS